VDMGAITVAQSPTGGQTMSFHITTNYKKTATVSDATKKS
jgi:hypothetical protein